MKVRMREVCMGRGEINRMAAWEVGVIGKDKTLAPSLRTAMRLF